jgi:flagellar FliJ protein
MLLQELVLYERSLKQKTQTLKGMLSKASQLQARTEQQRVHLTEASKDKTLMEKLKSKKEEEYRQDMRREEMNHLDEMALLLEKKRL